MEGWNTPPNILQTRPQQWPFLQERSRRGTVGLSRVAQRTSMCPWRWWWKPPLCCNNAASPLTVPGHWSLCFRLLQKVNHLAARLFQIWIVAPACQAKSANWKKMLNFYSRLLYFGIMPWPQKPSTRHLNFQEAPSTAHNSTSVAALYEWPIGYIRVPSIAHRTRAIERFSRH